MQEAKLDYMTMTQAAAVLQVSKDAVRRLINQGTLPASRWGDRIVRVARIDIERVAAELAKKNQEAALAAQQAKSQSPLR